MAPANSRAVGGYGRARRHGLRLAEIIGLIDILAVDVGGGEAGLHLGVGVGQEHRSPVFVGEAEPGVGDVPALTLDVDDLLVGFFLLAVGAHHADRALVQNVIAEHRRRAVSRDQSIGKQRDRRAALLATWSLMVKR